LFICNYGIAGNLIKSEMYKVGQACSQCPDGTTCSTRYPGLCTGEPSSPLTVRPPLWPWELPEGFPTSGPLDPDKPLVTGFVDISGNPDAVIDPPDVVAPPTIVPDDNCIYTCRIDKGCSVKIVTNRVLNGSVLGSCFPPSFGGSCSGTPEKCNSCSQDCVGQYGNTITVKLDQNGKPGKKTIEPLTVSSASSSGSQSGGNSDTCHYNCQESGGCTVRINAKGPVNGNTLGSCFSELFGGKCSGTPTRCHKCLPKCEGKKGQEFSEPAN